MVSSPRGVLTAWCTPGFAVLGGRWELTEARWCWDSPVKALGLLLVLRAETVPAPHPPLSHKLHRASQPPYQDQVLPKVVCGGPWPAPLRALPSHPPPPEGSPSAPCGGQEKHSLCTAARRPARKDCVCCWDLGKQILPPAPCSDVVLMFTLAGPSRREACRLCMPNRGDFMGPAGLGSPAGPQCLRVPLKLLSISSFFRERWLTRP